jgi:hypothetical protein
MLSRQNGFEITAVPDKLSLFVSGFVRRVWKGVWAFEKVAGSWIFLDSWMKATAAFQTFSHFVPAWAFEKVEKF